MPELNLPISHSFNEANGARFADFGGWKMPTFYSSIIEEHKATRENIGLFDVSHMGRWLVSGKDALFFLNYLVTNDITAVPEGKGVYAAMLNEDGGIIDDVIIYKISTEEYILVNNAGNHEIDTAWYEKLIEEYDTRHSAKQSFASNADTNKNGTMQSMSFDKAKDPGLDITMMDMTEVWGQIAVQGPKAKAAVEDLLGIEETLKYFEFGVVDCGDDVDELVVAATGYTGEQGYELYGDPDLLMDIWQDLIEDYDAIPCGLGSRDLLRLEAGYCLHGNDIDASTTPYEAGLEWVTKMNKQDFVGKVGASRKAKKLVGLSFEEGEKMIPRAHTKVLNLDGQEIGEITSGNFSQMLNKAIAIAYIKPDYQANEVKIVIRDKEFIAQLGAPWFYRNIRSKEIQDFGTPMVAS